MARSAAERSATRARSHAIGGGSGAGRKAANPLLFLIVRPWGARLGLLDMVIGRALFAEARIGRDHISELRSSRKLSDSAPSCWPCVDCSLENGNTRRSVSNTRVISTSYIPPNCEGGFHEKTADQFRAIESEAHGLLLQVWMMTMECERRGRLSPPPSPFTLPALHSNYRERRLTISGTDRTSVSARFSRRARANSARCRRDNWGPGA